MEEMTNPWQVQSLDEFLFYNCPECNQKSPNKDLFVYHAWQHHPKSQETLISLNEKRPENEIVTPKDDIIVTPKDDIECPPSVADGERLEVKLEGELMEEDDDLLKSDLLSDLDDDLDLDFEGNGEESQCYYCGLMVKQCDMRDHMTETHGNYHGRMHGPPRPFQCDNCHATFQTQSALGLHLCYDQFIAKKKYGEPYKCDKCDKTYQNRKTFRYHLQSAHTNLKKYKCDQCDFSTKTSSSLSSHVHR